MLIRSQGTKFCVIVFWATVARVNVTFFTTKYKCKHEER